MSYRDPDRQREYQRAWMRAKYGKDRQAQKPPRPRPSRARKVRCSVTGWPDGLCYLCLAHIDAPARGQLYQPCAAARCREVHSWWGTWRRSRGVRTPVVPRARFEFFGLTVLSEYVRYVATPKAL